MTTYSNDHNKQIDYFIGGDSPRSKNQQKYGMPGSLDRSQSNPRHYRPSNRIQNVYRYSPYKHSKISTNSPLLEHIEEHHPSRRKIKYYNNNNNKEYMYSTSPPNLSNMRNLNRAYSNPYEFYSHKERDMYYDNNYIPYYDANLEKLCDDNDMNDLIYSPNNKLIKSKTISQLPNKHITSPTFSPIPNHYFLNDLPPPMPTGGLTYSKTTPLAGDESPELLPKYKTVRRSVLNTDLINVEKSLESEITRLKQEISNGKKELKILEKKMEQQNSNLFKTQKEYNKQKEELLVEKRLLVDHFNPIQKNEENYKKFFMEQNKEFKEMIDDFDKKNEALEASSDVANKFYQDKLKRLNKFLQEQLKERDNAKKTNMQYELQVMELQENVNLLKEELDTIRHKNFLKNNINITDKEETKDSGDTEGSNEKKGDIEEREIFDYPNELVIQENLIRAQIEFYFSDYNLKRDKRLLEKICKEPKRGYLEIKNVLGLSRIRQLCNDEKTLMDAIGNSSFIDIKAVLKSDIKLDTTPLSKITKEIPSKVAKKDNNNELIQKYLESKKELQDNNNESKQNDDEILIFIGRKNFRPPSEKQFPFRRTVFIYGLPYYANTEYVFSMLSPFGGVTKVQFDHGPDTLDRQIMKKMLEKHRVYKLFSKDSASVELKYNHNTLQNQQSYYTCNWCSKKKNCSDGYYHNSPSSSQNTYFVCLQCAAAKAEDQLNKYDTRTRIKNDNNKTDNTNKSTSNKGDDRLRDLLLGLPKLKVDGCKTALCVFASQRQASKCVYVRSRLAFDGAFATHYHHYSKLKREIALTMKPEIKILSSNNPKSKISIPNIISEENKSDLTDDEKIQFKTPITKKLKTAPVYQSDGTNVIQEYDG